MKTLDLDNLNHKIEQLIADFYTTFASKKLKSILGVCNHCMSEENCQEIIKQPVEHINPMAIMDYLNAAEGHEDIMVSELKYLLPRIIELFTQGYEISISAELTFTKFYFNQPELWKDKEIKLIKHFAILHFQKIAIENNINQYLLLDELILMWHKSGLEVDFLFEIWEGMDSYPKVIIDYVHLFYNFRGMKYNNPYTSTRFSKQICHWAMSADVIQCFQKKVYASIEQIDDLTERELFDYECLLSLA